MSGAFDRAAAFEVGTPACRSSSLGKDSDEGSTAGAEEGEVQSAYTGVGLAGLGALEESLPHMLPAPGWQASKRFLGSSGCGISKFYNGKSRSFTFLREAITPSGSSRDIAKAGNAYRRKRKNLIAYSIMYDKSQNIVPSEFCENGTPERVASLSRATLRPLDSVISSSRSNSSISSEENDPTQEFDLGQSPDNSKNFTRWKIPVPQVGSCAPKTSSMTMRSFSMLDLHRLHRSCSSVQLEDKQKED